jgi:hypothetical protein
LKVLIYSYDVTTITPTYNAHTVPDSRVSEATPNMLVPYFRISKIVLLVCEPERAIQADNRYTVTYAIQRRVLKVTTFNVILFMYPYEYEANKGVYQYGFYRTLF